MFDRAFSRRHSNEAICEAAQRTDMRFVAVKTEEEQSAELVFRTRDLTVRQRTQLINASPQSPGGMRLVGTAR